MAAEAAADSVAALVAEAAVLEAVLAQEVAEVAEAEAAGWAGRLW